MFATSGVAFPPTDPLYRMCDAPLHWDCYAKWPDRARFARTYFEMRSGVSNPYWVNLLLDEDVHVALGDEVIQIRLAATASGREVVLADWDAWLARQPEDGPHPVQREALARVLDRLRALGSAAELRARGLSAGQRAELKARDAGKRAKLTLVRCSKCQKSFWFGTTGDTVKTRCGMCELEV